MLSRRLVELDGSAPIDRDLTQVAFDGLRAEAAVELFKQDGMHSLAKELAALVAAEGATGAAAGQPAGQQPAAGQAATEQPAAAEPPLELETWQTRRCHYEAVRDPVRLEQLVAEARGAGRFAFDSETDHIDPVRAHPVGFSIALRPDSGWYIPLRCPEGGAIPEATVRQQLERLLGDEQLELVGQNIKYDYKVLKRWGIVMRNRLFDTMIAAWLLQSDANTYGLDRLALRHLHYQTIHFEDLLPGAGAEATFDSVPLEQATSYAAEDADIALRLADLFLPQLADQQLDQLMRTIEMPLIPVLGDMELQRCQTRSRPTEPTRSRFRRGAGAHSGGALPAVRPRVQPQFHQTAADRGCSRSWGCARFAKPSRATRPMCRCSQSWRATIRCRRNCSAIVSCPSCSRPM